MGVGRCAELGGAGAENLGLSFQLGVDLKSDGGDKFHGFFLLYA
jgi:hypothetical protein